MNLIEQAWSAQAPSVLHRLVLLAVASSYDEAGQPSISDEDLITRIGHEHESAIHQAVIFHAMHGQLERREDGRLALTPPSAA